MELFALQCMADGTNYPVRTVTIQASSKDAATQIFNESDKPPFPQMRERGYRPVRVRAVC